MTRVAVYSAAPVGPEMASPAIRSYELARALANELDVTFIAPGASRVDKLRGVDPPASRRELEELLQAHDAVLAQKLPARLMRRLAASSRQVVYDLYTPSWLESLSALHSSDRDQLARLHARAEALTQKLALVTGNAYICTHERQRDYWIGALGALGRIGPERYERDPTVRELIEVVPFGLSDQPPLQRTKALREGVPGIGPDDFVLLWLGGVVAWTDPETVIRAVAEVAARRADVRLVFVGVDTSTGGGRAAAEIAASLELLDRVVFFLGRWVPYDERADVLLDADVGVAAYHDAVEARLAFRARLLDNFWAGLPTITTSGEALGDLVAKRGLGRVVAAGDVAGWAAAIEALADKEERRRCSEGLALVREELSWPRIVAPAARLLRTRGHAVNHSRAARIELELNAVQARISYALRRRLMERPPWLRLRAGSR